eukprot:TRINITY_DN3780_c0_g1_i2.p1 TRINITY_DN3780_c0_g1~~TRINITY_DN3780_c0_g1_i2.p1  ORF type:complete len:755 (-),score=262.22 TRINITY_DN3780_c0_g1_i2:188-2452(-)
MANSTASGIPAVPSPVLPLPASTSSSTSTSVSTSASTSTSTSSTSSTSTAASTATSAASSTPTNASPSQTVSASTHSASISTSSSTGHATSGPTIGDWTEYTTPAGKKYYYNKATKVSVWDKPNEFKTAKEKEVEKSPSCPWKEYVADSKKKYYYNSLTRESTWEMPDEFRESKERERQKAEVLVETEIQEAAIAATQLQSPRDEASVDKNIASSPRASTSTTQLTSSSPNTPTSSETEEKKAIIPLVKKEISKKDAHEAFMQMLEDMDIPSTANWDIIVRRISGDERYKSIKGTAEKKQLFHEYLGNKKRAEREEMKMKERKVYNDFFQMLKEQKEVNLNTPFKQVASTVEKDPRFLAIESDGEREDIYEDFLWDMEKNQREDIRQQRKENMGKFKKLLEDTPSVTVRTPWRKAKEQFKDEECFLGMEKIDRLFVFEEHIRQLERKEFEERRIDRDRQRRTYRKNRDAFKALINEKFVSGGFHPRSKWRDFLNAIESEERYQNMIGQPGSTARELYGDFVEDLEERYQKDKKILKEVFKASNLVVTGKTSFEEFDAAIRLHEKYGPLNKNYLRFFFNELLEKAIKEEKSDEKRKKKYADRFLDLLQSLKKISPTTTYEEMREELTDHSAFSKVESEEERIRLFQEHIAYLKEKEANGGKSSSESEKSEKSSRKEKKGKRKHSSRRSSDDEDDKKKKKKHKKEKKRKHLSDDDKHSDKEERSEKADKSEKGKGEKVHKKKKTNDGSKSDDDSSA